MVHLFLAGASGSVGLECAHLAQRAGYSVTALCRSRKGAGRLGGRASRVVVADAALEVPSLEGVDVVLSALGASVAPSWKDRASYREVDLVANLNLYAEARKAGVARFVYVAAHLEDAYRGTRYIRAHEDFVEVLRKSGMSYAVVRPTGIFSAFASMLPMARKGRAVVVGDGAARTNPIHQRDVARACMENLFEGPAEVSIGGPEVFTRTQIAEMAFEAVGKPGRVFRVPGGFLRGAGSVTRLMHPRVGELFQFVAEAATNDCVAPEYGREQLRDYFAATAALAEV